MTRKQISEKLIKTSKAVDALDWKGLGWDALQKVDEIVRSEFEGIDVMTYTKAIDELRGKFINWHCIAYSLSRIVCGLPKLSK